MSSSTAAASCRQSASRRIGARYRAMFARLVVDGDLRHFHTMSSSRCARRRTSGWDSLPCRRRGRGGMGSVVPIPGRRGAGANRVSGAAAGAGGTVSGAAGAVGNAAGGALGGGVGGAATGAGNTAGGALGDTGKAAGGLGL
jgi:hypothetical protein